MIQSMTGYGSYEKDGVKAEIRSLNHRFLDIHIKAPPIFLQNDIYFRKAIKENFSRGHFDIYITLPSDRRYDITVNEAFVKKLTTTLGKIKKDYHLEGDINIDTLLSFKEVVLTETNTINEKALFAAFNHAVSNLKKMRQQEGKLLKADILKHLDSIKTIVKKIKSLHQESPAAMMSKIRKRIKELLSDVEPDETRILQEAAILSERADISEEIVRIQSHLQQFRKNLSNNDKIGRKLDFLFQELYRESNTIASKTNVYQINALAVDLKSEIEKVREQIQNIQ